MDDKERKARHIFPKFDDINTYTVRVFDQLRKVRRIGNNDIRALNPGTLIFTDCTHPMQNVICPEEKITAWRVDMPNVKLTGGALLRRPG
jgi:hypothetical protein